MVSILIWPIFCLDRSPPETHDYLELRKAAHEKGGHLRPCLALDELQMTGTVLAFVSAYGYYGLFGVLVVGIFGLPVPDETLLVFSGFLAYRGVWSLLPVCAIALVASVCGITVSYLLGRTAGAALVRRKGQRLHLTPERLERVHGWFCRFGRWTLVFGYFVPGLRHLTAMVAGTSRLELTRFAPFAYAGALIWSQTFVLAGYFLGESWHKVRGLIPWLALALVTALLLAAAGLLLSRRFRHAAAPAARNMD